MDCESPLFDMAPMSLMLSIISQNFMSDAQFCFRACKEGPKAPAFCKHSTAPRVALTYFLTMMKFPGQHIYDVMGCDWNMPANYSPDVFEQCQGDSGEVRANDYMRMPDIDLSFTHTAYGCLWSIHIPSRRRTNTRCPPDPIFLFM